MTELTSAQAALGIETLLYSISTFLYLPVLFAIVAMALYLLICLGGFLAEWRERKSGVRVLVVKAEAQMVEEVARSDGHAPLDARLEKVMQGVDCEGVRRLEAVRFMVRAGPALGLMGTLIPMGMALAGLAQGNLPDMARNMTTAFTATVVGLACGVGAYVLSLAREHWLRTDMADVAYAAEALLARQTVTTPGVREPVLEA
jgi:hypothetical protein